ncbi:hypothetical protein ACIGW7_11875 [Streptomyces sp. NPDC053253]|uniref:hypothetical protein n=1 Tax=Streptomyces sp. NPDC053253 TaxID=3365699 RepID=UPI0037D1D9A1
MVDENGEQNEKDASDKPLWGIIGLVVGGVLAFKVLSAMGVREGDPASLMEILIGLALFLGPFWVIVTASEHLHADVKAERSTKATYWATMVGISVAALTLVGVTSVDDLIGLAK